MAIAPQRTGIGIRRHFTTEGVHPYDEVAWELRDARITNFRDGSVAFEQLGVEVPATWSLNATNILAQKYFRGTMGTPERECSLKQVADRVVDTITAWGIKDGYFVDDAEAETFRDELKHLIIHQKAAFNSPVWFNIGVHGVPQQASACFILSVEDSMDSILNWYTEEGIIFKGGSGAGVNLSRIRSSHELLKGGGTASGPVSFMRGADASAGTIKSGGKTRRAAKMVILDADHPDIEDFIWCKAIEERKARVLRDAGFDMDLDGADSFSMQYQNANNSVRVTDEFMQAVVDGADWHLRARTDGSVIRTLPARDLFRQIAHAAWECADPGMQFDTTINAWHTTPNTGRINGSNPCCFVGETQIMTAQGLLTIEAIKRRCEEGSELPLVTARNPQTGALEPKEVVKAWVAGYTNDLVDVLTERGGRIRCTPEHRFLTVGGGYVEARSLREGARLQSVGDEDLVARVERVLLEETTAVYDMEVADVHNFAVAVDAGQGVIVSNSEYMHLDNSACNLASLNLMKFLNEDNTFDVAGFQAAVEVIFTGQEILVGNADYPTKAIAENSRLFRELGIGYANLGALLMANGLPYDSDEGRAWAGAITALLTGHAYATSARTAARMGPFAGSHENAEAMVSVLRKHQAEAAKIDEDLVPPELLSAAQQAWDEAVELAEQHGVRNSQASVLAPTGCLVGGTLVSTGRGLVRLRSLGDPDGDRWQELGVPVATDEGARVATKFYVNGAEQVVTVETAQGHRVQGTPTHRIKVVDPGSGEWVWRRFGDVRDGDLVPLALGSMVGEPQEVALPPLADAPWTGEHDVQVPRQMTPALAEVVGFFMGGGSLESGGLRLHVADTDFEVLERLQLLCKESFGVPASLTPRRGHAEVSVDSVRLALWWEACGFAKRPPVGSGSGKGHVAHIPDAVLHSNDRGIYAAFLRGLYEADGDAVAGYPNLETSGELARELQAVLLGLGFPTTLSVKDRTDGSSPAAVLRLLNASYNESWLEQIGFMGNRKSAAVHMGPSTESQADQMDDVPLPVGLVERLAPGRELPLGTVSRRVATELFEQTGDDELGRLLAFFYDRVTSAELGDDELTFDLSVPDNVTYIANGFVSHNTIGLLMDCDTTGVEPDLGLVKTKKLVGGGTMSIVNQTVPRALRQLGYGSEQVEDIVAYINEHKTIVGAPGLAAEHLPVFACSMGDNTIHYSGHVRMMGAIQPFISGAISKTINTPEDVTVEDVEQLHIDAWKLGIKAVAIYRDNCKVAQPLSTTRKEVVPVGGDDAPPGSEAEARDREVAARIAELEEALAHELARKTEPLVVGAVRERLPRRRRSRTFAFRVADCEGYVTVGEYEDGRPGEVFIKVSKQGSTLAGIMDAFSISISLGLQHGVPLATYVRKYSNMKFEPAGITDDADLRIASSLVDYIFRRVALDYLSYEERLELGVLSTSERLQPTLPGVEESATPSVGLVDEGVATSEPTTHLMVPPVPSTPTAGASATLARAEQRDAPFCYSCGNVMQRSGSCYVCPSCGSTSGCS